MKVGELIENISTLSNDATRDIKHAFLDADLSTIGILLFAAVIGCVIYFSRTEDNNNESGY